VDKYCASYNWSITYLLTYLLAQWSRALLEKLTGLQLVKKFPAFYGTRRFITAFTIARHLSLSWSSPIQSISPHTISWRSILILSSHLHLCLPISLFPSGFPTKTLYTPLPSPYRAIYPADLNFFYFITRTILVEEYRSWGSSGLSDYHHHKHQGLALWSAPSPGLQLLSPTFLRSSNWSSSLWPVVVWL
jgi:hypothetical protein